MTIAELYKILDEKYPASLSCEWDNDGMMCCPDPNVTVKKILITLDITETAVSYAAENNFDLIISHHPIIFKAQKAMTLKNNVQRKTIALIKNNISAFSFHTRLDAAQNGVNDVLAGKLQLQNVRTFGNETEVIGRIGTLSEKLTLFQFAEYVKNVLNSDSVKFAGNFAGEVSNIAVVGGDGKDFVFDALRAGADTYITGRASYNIMEDASEIGINIIEAGHYFTEFPVCGELSRVIKEILPEAYSEIFNSNAIREV